MSKKTIQEVLDNENLEPCTIFPIPEIGEIGSMEFPSRKNYFNKIKIFQDHDGVALVIFHRSGHISFRKGDHLWEIETKDKLLLKCVIPSPVLKYLEGKNRQFFFYFQNETDRDLILSLFEKFV